MVENVFVAFVTRKTRGGVPSARRAIERIGGDVGRRFGTIAERCNGSNACIVTDRIDAAARTRRRVAASEERGCAIDLWQAICEWNVLLSL